MLSRQALYQRQHTSRRGVTLAEIAILLVFFGIFLGMAPFILKGNMSAEEKAEIIASQKEAEVASIKFAFEQSEKMDKEGALGDGFERLKGNYDNSFILRSKFRPKDAVIAPTAVVIMCDRKTGDDKFTSNFADRQNSSAYKLRADLNSAPSGNALLDTLGDKLCADYSKV